MDQADGKTKRRVNTVCRESEGHTSSDNNNNITHQVFIWGHSGYTERIVCLFVRPFANKNVIAYHSTENSAHEPVIVPWWIPDTGP